MIRPAQLADVDEMAALADAKRRTYERHAPVFQRPASNALAVHRPWLRHLVEDEQSGVFVHHDEAGSLDGFVVIALGPAPPVYDPGGLSSLVDDFAVAVPDTWDSVGGELLDAAQAWASARGAVQIVVVCGPHDEPKRALLLSRGLYVASEWFTTPLDSS